MNSTQSTEAYLQKVILESIWYLNPGSNIFPRTLAGELLQHVGSCGEYGGVANGVSPFLIGVAIQRLVSNYTEGDEWKIEFLKGLFYHPNATIQAAMNVYVTPEDRNLA
jgi:hypothetical protein